VVGDEYSGLALAACFDVCVNSRVHRCVQQDDRIYLHNVSSPPFAAAFFPRLCLPESVARSRQTLPPPAPTLPSSGGVGVLEEEEALPPPAPSSSPCWLSPWLSCQACRAEWGSREKSLFLCVPSKEACDDLERNKRLLLGLEKSSS
jgi:hypothetical protein